MTTDAGWIITVLRRDGEEGRAYELVSFLVVVFLAALKAGRDVTVFSVKFWNLDH